METQEFFKKWKKDSPKSFEEFKIFLEKQWYPFDDTYIDEYCNFWIEMGDDRKSELPFEMLTGIIEKFFEENDFGFEFRIIKEYSPHKVYFCCSVLNLEPYKDLMLYIFSNVKTKQEAKISAYLKAAEILERELD